MLVLRYTAVYIVLPQVRTFGFLSFFSEFLFILLENSYASSFHTRRLKFETDKRLMHLLKSYSDNCGSQNHTILRVIPV